MNPEEGFLRQIQQEPEDPIHRQVYADWLEERGDPRAGYLRLQAEMIIHQDSKGRRKRLRKKLRQFEAEFDPNWLAAVDFAPIGCMAGVHSLTCKEQWHEMECTDEHTQRHCKTCDQPVYYCGSLEEAKYHLQQDRNIALSSRIHPTQHGELLDSMIFACRFGEEEQIQTPEQAGLSSKVKILAGTFQDQSGTMIEINVDRQEVLVEVEQFGRKILIILQSNQLMVYL